ncbi:hypothetical protein [Microvirga lotononidis]|uniref:Uncharacterized protein n=1 Tax=Microvirga lotononidis TaxID=864069 RepID=I4Z1Y4_9HYPH|nr:hypothetical protein [Microvirga lotononidis]EIM30226.1 hypothetical protein MicloDRAFT_00010310 [Microvirga lotononidis]WQO32071.1 hypothetical protein U0023_29710 [Microvirga lotononidis]
MARNPREPTAEERREELDRDLDEELEDTFPASDPLKVTRGPPKSRITGDVRHEPGHRRPGEFRKRLRDHQ